MQCTNCQKDIPDNIKFCPYCGQPVLIRHKEDNTTYSNTFENVPFSYGRSEAVDEKEAPVNVTKIKDSGINDIGNTESGNKKTKVIFAISVILVIALVAGIIGYRYYISKDKTVDESIPEYINGITYCEKGVIYVDTDVTDDAPSLKLATVDEALVIDCEFYYLSIFNPDTTRIYYITDLEQKKTTVCGSLYSIATKDITNDPDENKKRSTLISKEVKGYFTTSGDDNSILYDTLSDEIYIYSDNGNEYLMDGKDILVINTFYNTESSHLITVQRGNLKNVTLSTGLYMGATYEIYHYDTATKKLRLIDDDVAMIPTGKDDKLVYLKGENYLTEGADMYMCDITPEGIKTEKLAEDVTDLVSTTITDDITHIAYATKGEHTDDYTFHLYSYDNGVVTDIGETENVDIYSEYVTFFDYYEPDDEEEDKTQYYNTGSSEIYKSPFGKVIEIQEALQRGKLMIQALDDNGISCVYMCDIEYGKEITDYELLAYNASISGIYARRYLFYVSGQKTRNMYLSSQEGDRLILRDVPKDESLYFKATPYIDDNLYYFVVDLLESDGNSSIYDLYVRDDEDKSLKRLDTMVEDISITGKGAVYCKDEALYYYGADTKKTTKIADSYYYCQVGNQYETSASTLTYIRTY